MFAVIFEVEPHPDRWDAYLAHAAALRPELERIDGFLDNKRYRSLRRPGWVLSLSLWRDEKSVIRWRTHEGHHAVQDAGRQSVFRDYHLRVGEVAARNGFEEKRTRLDETETGKARAVSLIENPDIEPPEGVADWDRFEGITVPGSSLLLLSWHRLRDIAPSMPSGTPQLDVAILRDYGLHDRREAPQFHRPAPTSQS